MLYRFLGYCVAIIALCVLSHTAMAAPMPWQIDFQEAASPVAERLHSFHNMLMVIITVITIFVMCLLGYVCVRFSHRVNPKPSTTSHNTLLEVIWTGIPIIILVAIAIPSLRHLYFIENIEKADMTLKVIGYQWYWGYSYPDNDNIAFDSYILKDEELKKDDIRLLSVDNPVVLPVDTTVRLQITAADVIHSFAVPALGLKHDAVPGRLNEAWVRITKPGVYYGQCSELCGVGHGFMPVMIKAVSKEQFAAWVAEAKKKFANAPEERQVAIK